MSLVQYFQRPGPSGKDCIAAGFSNAVKLPQNAQLVLTAGQAGIDLSTGQLVESSPEAQIEACFDFCDVALKSAGVVDSLASAFKIISLLPDQRYDPLMMAIWRRRYPDHRPIWMSVGSGALGLKGMVVELQAEAYIIPGQGKGMPGPTRWRKQEAVLGAIKAGQLTEETIDERVKQLLAFLDRLGYFHDPQIPDEQAINNPRHQSLIRDVGSRGLVLLKNDSNILPLRPAKLQGKKIALLGYAKTALSFTYKQHEPNNPVPVEVKNMHPNSFVSVFVSVGFGDCGVSLEGIFEVHDTGEYYFSCAGLGPSKLFIDDQLVEEQTDNYPDAMGFMFGGAFSNKIKVRLDGGKKYKILAYTCPPTPKEGESEDMGLLEGHVGLQVGFTPALELDWDYTAGAVRLAKEADIVIAFTGHEPVWETGGKDQVSFHLPKDGSQDRLVSAVAEANPNVIVVNSTGVPIAMSWLKNIKALVQSWYPGQECGNTIADILTGRTTLEGHLPCIFPRDIRDCPAYGNFPGQSVNKKLTVTYEEGVFVGYRHFDLLAQDKVNFPFGFGPSYTSFDFRGFSVREIEKGTLEASFQLTNTGGVAGGIAVQIYVGKENRPKTDSKNQLAGFKKVRLQPEESQVVRIIIEDRDFVSYDETERQWVLQGGTCRFMVGRSAQDIVAEMKVSIERNIYGRHLR